MTEGVKKSREGLAYLLIFKTNNFLDISVSDKGLVTAVSFIRPNLRPPPGTETPVEGEVYLKQLPLGGPTTMFCEHKRSSSQHHTWLPYS
ncbi:hypothetical protein OS493_034000 [Desmophyllum pertusum]|uniref:Uncharacterized protein n=1 Tax=Desmophyllum pertusum TaxID=174260 RepID=A0A9X0CX01_9CNID|nr:hypothetical protein OS493_034000 [Desmophyllum pertusum]